MSYKALYRKYRPQTFSQVVGQAAIVKTLQNGIISGKISHAYLFCGPRGTGKTSIARIFAKALNCENQNNGEPCSNCTNCKEISESMSPDVVEIDAASNNGVDEIRDIREKVKFLPSGSKYKIYIIDEVHMLSTGAFNALLKTLEEPPKHVIFILATTEPQKLPATIISRCQRYDFKPLGTYELSMQLKNICEKEDAIISEDAINAISEAADGGMRDALSILDQVISYGNKDISIDDVNTITGTISFDKMNLLMNYIESKNVNFALDTVNDFLQTGKEVSKIIAAILVFCRDILLYKNIGNKNNNKYIFEKEKFQELAFKLQTNKVLYYIDVLCDMQNKIKASTTPNIYLELAIIKMCSISDADLDLMKRVTELETKIETGDFAQNGIENQGNNQVDNEKLSLLDTKINQVVTEFNKLEIHKLAQRIDDLTQIVTNRINQANDTDSELDVKKEIEELKFQIENIKNDNLVTFDENDKIHELEEKISMLSREKVNAPVISDDVNFAIENLKNDVNYLKSNQNSELNEKVILKINELDEKINSISFNNVNSNDVNVDENIILELNNLKREIANINSKEIAGNYGVDFSNQLEELKQQLDEVKNKSTDYADLKSKLEYLYEYVNLLDTKETAKMVVSENGSELLEIKDKLQSLESKMYKFISSAMSNNKPKAKPEKKANGQIMLFGDDIVGLDDIEKATKENTDFEELKDENKSESALIEEELTNDEVSNAESDAETSSLNVEDFTDNEENSIEPEQEETNEESSTIEVENIVEDISDNEEKDDLFAPDNSITKKEINFDVNEESIDFFDFGQKVGIEEQENAQDEIKETSDNLFESTTKIEKPVEKPKNEIIDQYFDPEKKESVVNKTNSSIVIKQMDTSDIADGDEISKSLLMHESTRVQEAANNHDNKEIFIEQKQEFVDKFAAYNIKDVEQLLYEALSETSINDKKRITEVWKTISRGISVEYLPIASLLSEGYVASVGNKEIILTFNSVSKCNQVMRMKFKKEAMRILYEKLGDTYNYIALPDNVWNEKRKEYVNQYRIGIKRPTLTPFQIEGLSVIDKRDEFSNKEDKIISQAINVFGDDLVKIK